MGEHEVTVQYDMQVHRAVCLCGWKGPLRAWDIVAATDGGRHLLEAPLARGNACRYCFTPIEDPAPLYCSTACERADRRRPDPEAVSAVLSQHSEAVEPILPGPDQMELFG